jgi:hypothetical protein
MAKKAKSLENGTKALKPSEGAARKVSKAAAPAAIGTDMLAVESAREVFETLARWRGEVAHAAEAMTIDCARSAGQAGAAEMAKLLAGQRQVLQQIESTLAQVQELIAHAEKQLVESATAEGEGAVRLPLGFNVGLPLTASLQALQIMQQMSASNMSLWAKAAQGAQGMWLDAVQAMMPGKGAEAEETGRKPARGSRRAH